VIADPAIRKGALRGPFFRSLVKY
ncbi:elongation factor Tu, partial [Pseudomonas aeruginosa]